MDTQNNSIFNLIQSEDRNKSTESDKHSLKQLFTEYCFAWSGQLSVYLFYTYGDVNPVLASSVLTLIITLIFPEFFVPIFQTGCLASIMDPEAVVNIGFIFSNGLVITLIYYFGKNLFLNIGGRAGTIAFLSNLTLITLQNLVYSPGANTYTYPVFKYLLNLEQYKYLNFYIYFFGPLLTCFAAVLIHILAEIKDNIVKITHRCFAYGIVCTVGCLVLLTFKREYYNTGNEAMDYSIIYISFWHIGSLSGLTTKIRFKYYTKNYYFYHYLISGYIGGWIFIFLAGIFFLGGKHGFMAFLGNLVYLNLIEYLHSKNFFGLKYIKNENEIMIKIVNL